MQLYPGMETMVKLLPLHSSGLRNPARTGAEKDGRNVEDGKENRQDKKTEQIKNKDYGNRET